MLNKKVKWAKTHQSVFFPPPLGEMKNTLTADPTGKHRDLVMTTTEVGLLVEAKGIRGIVPYANIISMELAPEEVAPKKA